MSMVLSLGTILQHRAHTRSDSPTVPWRSHDVGHLTHELSTFMSLASDEIRQLNPQFPKITLTSSSDDKTSHMPKRQCTRRRLILAIDTRTAEMHLLESYLQRMAQHIMAAKGWFWFDHGVFSFSIQGASNVLSRDHDFPITLKTSVLDPLDGLSMLNFRIWNIANISSCAYSMASTNAIKISVETQITAVKPTVDRLLRVMRGQISKLYISKFIQLLKTEDMNGHKPIPVRFSSTEKMSDRRIFGSWIGS